MRMASVLTRMQGKWIAQAMQADMNMLSPKCREQHGEGWGRVIMSAMSAFQTPDTVMRTQQPWVPARDWIRQHSAMVERLLTRPIPFCRASDC